MTKIIIDVREPEEFASGHVEGAVNIPLDQLLAGSKQLVGARKDTEIVLYCRTGNRSALAKNILESYGFTKIINGLNKQHIEAGLYG